MTRPVTVERRIPGKLYGRTATEITGPPERAAQVRYRRVLTSGQHRAMMTLGGTHMLLVVVLVVYLLLPGNLPRWNAGQHLLNGFMIIGLGLMILLQLIVVLRTWVLTFFAAGARDPIPMPAPAGLRVAVLTTIVPGKEPIELVMATLRAMKRIRHDGPVDVWLLDEGDDADVRRRCAEIGVKHFSRKGRPEWNQAEGPFRAKTKHGNHNAWRSEQPPRLAVAGLPPAVAALCLRCLAVDPADRPSAAEVETVLTGAARDRRPRRLVVALALLLVVVAVAVAGVVMLLDRGPVGERAGPAGPPGSVGPSTGGDGSTAAPATPSAPPKSGGPASTGPRPTGSGPTGAGSGGVVPTRSASVEEAARTVYGVLDRHASAGAVRPDVAEDLRNQVDDLVFHPADPTQRIESLRRQIRERQRQGGLSAAAADELDAAITALARAPVWPAA